MRSLSREITVSKRNLVIVTLVCRVVPPGRPDSHPNRVTITKFRLDTVISRDEEHIVSRIM